MSAAAAHSGVSSVQHLGFDKAQQSHLNSQIADIALDLRKNTNNYIDGDGELRIGRRGSLSINPNGLWYDFAETVGSHGAITLSIHLMDGVPSAEVRQYLVQRLALPRGTFAANQISDAEQEAQDRGNAEYAREVLGRMQPVVPGTDTYTYLGLRGLLDGPMPACVGHLQLGRTAHHESGIIGILTNVDGDPVAIQLGHLMADGTKSPHLPQRNRYNIDKAKAAGAMFAIPATPLPDDQDVPDVVRQFAATFVLCEGLEDTISLHRALPYSEIGGFPGGIGTARHLKPVTGARLLVFADGDAPDSPARRSLIKGVDALIIAGAEVMLAMPPLGTDANDLLRAGGVASIHDVAATAVLATLSQKGHYAKAAHTPDEVYEFTRKTLAHEAGIRVSVLDRERARLRQQTAVEEELKPRWATWDDTLWPAPISDIAAVCDSALNEVTRYVVGNPDELPVVVLWCLFAHFMHHPVIELNISPRLAIQAATKRCGKTTLLEVVECMVPRPETQGGAITEAAFRHLVDEYHVSVLIDEAHEVFRRHSQDSHLMAILKSGHRRHTARTTHMGPSPDGRSWEIQRPSTWAPIAYTQIGRLGDGGMDDRALFVHLPRAQRRELGAHLLDGASPELKVIRQKFARFSADTTALPDVARSNLLFSRDGDNWLPLFRLAHLIGGEWPSRVMTAATLALSHDKLDGTDRLEALLTDIRTVFGEKAQMTTLALCAALNDMEEPTADWQRTNKGHGVTPTYLRDEFTKLQPNPPRSRLLSGAGRNARGYELTQFADAFARYLRTPITDSPLHSSPDPHHPQQRGNSSMKTAAYPAEDGAAEGAAEGVAAFGRGAAAEGAANGAEDPPQHHPQHANPLENKTEMSPAEGAEGRAGDGSGYVFPDGVPLPFDLGQPPSAAAPDDDVFRIDGEPDAP